MGVRRFPARELGCERKGNGAGPSEHHGTIRGRMRGKLQRSDVPAVGWCECNALWIVVAAANDADQEHLVRRNELQLESFAAKQYAAGTGSVCAPLASAGGIRSF